MTFTHLAKDDLTRLTRAQLLDRLSTENAYWERQSRKGSWTPGQAEAHREFGQILHEAFNLDDMISQTSNLVNGEAEVDYWQQIPRTQGATSAPGEPVA